MPPIRSGSGARRALVLLLAVAAFTPGVAVAQPARDPRPPVGNVAVEKGRQGVALYEKGEIAAALELFREAEAAYHSPVLVLYVARSLRQLGRLLEAKRTFEALGAETIDGAAPPAWKQAQIDGAAELHALLDEIPRLTIAAPGATAAARITVDGHAAGLDAPVELDPGEHVVVLEDGERRESRTVTLRRGERDARVGFEQPRVAAPAEVRPLGRATRMQVAPGARAGHAAEGGVRLRTLGIVLAGTGAAAVVAGGIVGGLALGEASSARESLPVSCDAQRRCPPHEQPAIDETFQAAYTLADVSTGLLIGGGVVAGIGIALWIFDPGGAPTARAKGSPRWPRASFAF